jgi:hypothetical protein
MPFVVMKMLQLHNDFIYLNLATMFSFNFYRKTEDAILLFLFRVQFIVKNGAISREDARFNRLDRRANVIIKLIVKITVASVNLFLETPGGTRGDQIRMTKVNF